MKTCEAVARQITVRNMLNTHRIERNKHFDQLGVKKKHVSIQEREGIGNKIPEV
jgi:hypothetical protein